VAFKTASTQNQKKYHQTEQKPGESVKTGGPTVLSGSDHLFAFLQK